MAKFLRILHTREALFTIGIFGITQMAADLFADFGYDEVAAMLRFAGIVLVVLVLVVDWRRRATSLEVPLLFAEEESRELLRSKFDRFVWETRLQKVVRELDILSPVQRSELYIRLSRNVRASDDPRVWQDAFEQVLREWEKEVDARLQRWLPGAHRGVVYHVRPNIVLPIAFALGNAVGLRRSIVLYHATPAGEPYQVMNLTQPRVLFEEPAIQIPLQQTPKNICLPQQRGERLILHLVVSDRHPPALDAHPDAQQATSVAIYLNQVLPQGDWLPYAQAIWAKASPWINAFQQIDLCLVGTDALMFALGMAFSRTPRLRVCHWFDGQYLPVIDLSDVSTRPPFD
ncbi:MAG: hypothetical protein NZ749_08505 [bacterium]|nr:hypothetical protein [bacterium]